MSLLRAPWRWRWIREGRFCRIEICTGAGTELAKMGHLTLREADPQVEAIASMMTAAPELARFVETALQADRDGRRLTPYEVEQALAALAKSKGTKNGD